MPEGNTSKSQSETATVSTNSDPKIKELEKQLAQKDAEISENSKKLSEFDLCETCGRPLD